MELPLNHVSGTGMPSNTGLGDALVGMKWCFRDQGEGWPKLGLLPQMTLPTGAADRGLGAGKATYGLPLLVEYERKSWLAFVNVGYVWQQAAGASDYGYYGATVCHEAGRRWQFGGELLGRAASDVGGRSLLAYNLGGEYELRRDVSVLFSAGHSLKGEDTSLLYAGLQFQLGTGSEANSERRMAPTQLEAPSAQEH
ncbi:MAG: transporter [Armatimonadota bacterium]